MTCGGLIPSVAHSQKRERAKLSSEAALHSRNGKESHCVNSTQLAVSRCARLAVAWIALFTAGCGSFQLRPYHEMVYNSQRRTAALSGSPFESRPLNRAASLPCRSQAEIKAQLEMLWQPSLRPSAWLNYNGLLATRYSQLDTVPSPVFVPGELVVRHLGTDTLVRYIAAFRPDRRLPLVVGTSGINGTVDGKITVDVLQSLYDTGGFHVIHLESLTSVNHQVRNQRPFLGGFPEGLLLYQTVAELRSRPEFADAVEQVHLLGVSYSGLLCGIAAHCEGKFQRGVIDGAVLALSPPLDLKVLFDNLAVNRIIYDKVAQSYLDDGVNKLVQSGELQLAREPQAITFDSYMRRVAFPEFRKRELALRADYPALPPIRDAEELYAISSLKPVLGSLSVPYLMLFAYDDPVVSPEDHFTRVLESCPNRLVDGILVPDGGHLGFDTVAKTPYTLQVAVGYFRYWSSAAAPATYRLRGLPSYRVSK